MTEQYEVYRKEGMRLKEEMSPLLYEHFYSSGKGKGWKGYHLFDKAHTVMLLEEQIIPKEAGIKILEALQQMDEEGVEASRNELGGHIHCGEAYVTKVMGQEVAGWIHCGRSSGDLLAVAYRVDARDGILRIMDALNRFRSTILQKAQEHIDTVMPGYTHLQHAEPITLGFYLMSFLHQFERDFDRLLQAYHRINVSPAGCAILTTTNFPINRERTAELLGFNGLFTNAKDAIWTQDHYWEYLSAMVGSAGVLARLADDLNVWHSSEFNMVDIPDAFCGTSSIMPQKKNGYGMETVRGLYGKVVGNANAFLVQTSRQSDACEMIVMGPAAMYGAQEALEAGYLIMEGVIADIQVDPSFLKARAGQYWTQAASLANMLTIEHGIPFRSAHQIVAILVRMAYEQGCNPSDVTPGMLAEARKQFDGEILSISAQSLQAALDPEQIVQGKRVVGGTAPEQIEADIVRSQDLLAQDQSKINVLREKQAESEETLDAAVKKWVENVTIE